eukprot:c18259_g1_i1.p1 GENE.c18259_g1_i1~~c18259_g1_i1.p1  ORF type:complete len:163 (+),score=46.45 c18259_g1_i1:55-489(+)
MKVYFCGSIRAGRQDLPIYQELIAYMTTKWQANVLTSHIGDPLLEEIGEKNLSEEEIYARDCAWMTEADLVVAEVTVPSLGVGYEIAFVEARKKPVLCLFRTTNGNKLSAMVRGCPNFSTKDYQTTEEAKELIDEFFVTNKPTQ